MFFVPEGAASGVRSRSQIHMAVQRNCLLAQAIYSHPGDDVAALIDYMNSPLHSFHDRSHRAVWTLGRLADPRALPALLTAYTGEPCNHNTDLCQHELEKAIRRCGGTPEPQGATAH